MRVMLIVAFLLTSAASSSAQGTCEGGTLLPSFAGKSITLRDDALFFRTKELELDIDGSPSAYGVRDQGIEDICNGLGPRQPPECKGKNQGACYAACQTAFRNWRNQDHGDLQKLDNWMCSIGLGGGGCKKANVRLQAAPRQDWFVSETSVKLMPPSGTSLSDWINIQPAQLDSQAIPYFVIPNGFRDPPWDATPGDIGAIIESAGAAPIPFIVGDTGGSLNEGSAKLHDNIRANGLPIVMRKSALGETVERLRKQSEFRIVIFRHTAPLLPAEVRGKLLVLDKDHDSLLGFIRTKAAEKLQAIGGAKRIEDCARP